MTADYVSKSFYFDNDLVISTPKDQDEFGNIQPDTAKLTEYGLRMFANVNFNSCDSGEPFIEITKYINEIADDYLDPMFSLVLMDNSGCDCCAWRGQYVSKLFYCNKYGADYVQLANYDGLFRDEILAIRESLIKYRDGEDLSGELLDQLKSLFNKGIAFIAGKIAAIQSIN